jgi:hypothetical protein
LEDKRFLERFRYVICTSQLLGDQVSVSLYDRDIGNEPLFGDDGVYATIGRRKMEPTATYWIGSGGCVLVIALLMTWAMKHPKLRILSSKERWTSAFALWIVFIRSF